MKTGFAIPGRAGWRCLAAGLVLSVMVNSTDAAPALHPLFTDGMVLQRSRPVAVYGTADSGESVTVQFAGQTKDATTGTDGKWMVHLDPLAASATPAVLTVTSQRSDSKLQISNVLVGDVWLCGGQSNMDHPFSSYSLLRDAVRSVDNSSIRLLALAHETGQRRDVPVFDKAFVRGWQACRTPALSAFSPVGYYFGSALHRELNVPVGLVESAWGGTQIEPWMSRDPDGNSGGLYNAMTYPLREFTFKGVIWYQGESNSKEPLEYAELFPELIRQWRSTFGQSDMPFYFVQLAPFKTLEWNKQGEAWAWLRESQAKTLKLPNTGMAVITDLGEFNDIHPQNKEPVGERLARFALKAEGRAIETDGPVFSRMKVSKDRCLIEFNHAGRGLAANRVVMNKNKDLQTGADPEAFVVTAGVLQGFSICGEDRRFMPAQAKIVGKDRVEVWSPEVNAPAAVRYGWDNFPLCNLFNSEGLPASPFRTDTFPPPNFDGSVTGIPLAEDVCKPGSPMALRPMTQETRSEPQEIKNRAAHRFTSAGEEKPAMAYWTVTDDSLRNGKTPAQAVVIVYFDEGKGQVELRYDSSDPSFVQGKLPPGAWKPGGLLKLTDTRTWRAVEFKLDDALFSGRCNGADLRLQSRKTFIVSDIFVRPLK